MQRMILKKKNLYLTVLISIGMNFIGTKKSEEKKNPIMSIFRLSLVVHFSIFFFFLIWCYNLYTKNTAILYYRSIFSVSVYCLFSYFTLIFCSNLYTIFISVLKVGFFFIVIYAKDRREKESLLDITSSNTYEAMKLL
jgi:hypothetical protein